MMDRERFQSLARAYGGEIARWPADERRAARWFAIGKRAWAAEALREAWDIDRLLGCSIAPDFHPGLERALLEGAAGLRPSSRAARPWLGAVLGLGVAAACAAGVGAGFAIAPFMTLETHPSVADPAEVAASALGNPGEFGDG